MKARGFTLVELLVVIAVVGVLMGIVVAVLNPATFFGRGQDSRRLSDLGQIQTALELDFADQDQYPPSLADLALRFTTIPTVDPDGVNYKYCPYDSSMKYEVCAELEETDATTVTGCSTGQQTTGDNCQNVDCCLTNPF